MVLAKHYDAVSVGKIEEMLALPAEKQFDVVVFCHSLSSRECDLAGSVVRQRWPDAKILALSIDQSSCWTSADRIIRGLDGPSVLVQAINRLLQLNERPSQCIKAL
jgi:hypothetical protein